MKKHFALFFACFWMAVLASCSFPLAAVETTLPNATGVYGTISAQLTATVTTPTPVQAITVTPLLTLSPTGVTSLPIFTPTSFSSTSILQPTLAAPSTTAIPVACDLAAPGRPFVDITIPDGTHLKSGQSFSKTWRLVNAGSCVWAKDYAIVWFSGELFGAVREQQFGTAICPGQSIDLTVDMVAPGRAGAHQSNWKLRNSRGALFGIGPTGDAPFWVRIEVEEAATPTVTNMPSPTITPTLTTLVKGTQELSVGVSVDLDSGKLSRGAGDDLALQKSDTAILLAPINNTRLANAGLQVPRDVDCRTANLTTLPVPSANLKEGEYWCYRTSQGLPGYFQVKTPLKDQKLTIEFLTWAIP